MLQDPTGPRSLGEPGSRIPCSQSSCEKAVDTSFSPPTPSTPLPTPLAAQELREGGGEEGSFLEEMLRHLESTFPEANAFWCVGGGRQEGPYTSPRTLRGRNHGPGLTSPPGGWGSGLVMKRGGHN